MVIKIMGVPEKLQIIALLSVICSILIAEKYNTNQECYCRTIAKLIDLEGF
jgi:hypothetical protein